MGNKDSFIDKVILDEEWNRTMCRIDAMSLEPRVDVSFECYHGYRHAFAVARYATNILRQLGATEHEVLLGKVSGLVHDMALTGGKEDHDKLGAQKAADFLRRLSMDASDIELISHAVAYHSNGEEIGSNLDLALLVADKLDVTRDRLAVTDGNLSSELNKVLEVSFEISSDECILKYQTDSDFDKKAIGDFKKMITIPQKAAEYLGRDFVFQINGKVQKVEDILWTID